MGPQYFFFYPNNGSHLNINYDMTNVCKKSINRWRRGAEYLVTQSLTQCGDLRNHRTHLLRFGEDPSGKLSQRALYLHSLIGKIKSWIIKVK